MNYFPPPSFIIWGSWSDHKMQRSGHFTIEPVNNQYNNEYYFTYTSYKDGKYISSAYNGDEYEIISPRMNSEELAIRWLEKKLKAFSKEKIIAANKKIKQKIKDNLSWISNLDKLRATPRLG